MCGHRRAHGDTWDDGYASFPVCAREAADRGPQHTYDKLAWIFQVNCCNHKFMYINQHSQSLHICHIHTYNPANISISYFSFQAFLFSMSYAQDQAHRRAQRHIARHECGLFSIVASIGGFDTHLFYQLVDRNAAKYRSMLSVDNFSFQI
jgi:hypothetical protein